MEEKTIYYISEAAKKVQVENHVLRYWEEELQLPIKRNEMGHRCYTEQDIRQLKEIKQLKEKQRRLEQQIRSASGDKKKARELEKKLEQVQSELSRKNNDTYRRQNALVSE